MYDLLYSPFSGNKKIKNLMNMIPNYKLPSFQFGIIEVVTTVAQAAVASNLITMISQLKNNSKLIEDVLSIAPGWISIQTPPLNAAFLQPAYIDRMAYRKNA